MSIKITDKSEKYKVKSILALDKTMATMMSDIERLSKGQVPHDIGTLQATGRIRRLGALKHEIRYGEAPPANAPYARRWEFETPPHGFQKGRKSRYLRDPAEAILKNKVKYFERAFSSIRI